MKSDLLILATLALAYCLSVIPLPDWAMLARPELPLLVFLYWVLAMPQRYGVAVAAMLGFFQDILHGTPLGVHVMTYALAAAAVTIAYQQIRMRGAWQQAAMIGLLLLLIQWLELLIIRMMVPVQPPVIAVLFLPAISGMLLWPWLMVFLRGLRRRLGIVNRFP